MTYLTCPHCGSTQKHRTIDSRRGVWRRHVCGECMERFTSYVVVPRVRPEYRHRPQLRGQMSLGL